MESDRTPFSVWLRQYRKQLDLTQKELANQIGFSESAFRKFESGARRPSRQIVERLAEYFGLTSIERASLLSIARAESHTAEDALYSPARAEQEDLPGRLGQYHTNLRTRLTPMIGREQEVQEVCNYLEGEQVRLLTLTGPPGIGKTRLGMQVATELLYKFQDGVFFVGLAAIRDPDLVAGTINQILGLRPGGGNRPAFDALAEHLKDKQMLLLLDNLEQVIEAAPLIVDLLERCPSVRVLATSREILHVRGEQQFVVPPLKLPDLTRLPSIEALSDYPAVALFVARARSIKPQFALTQENAQTVAAICARLDGVPLAIELATARINMLSPKAMLARLESRLPGAQAMYSFLVAGAHDLPARHQAMWEAIEWSYTLLDKGEQTLFARLGIFVGGCTLEAAEAVCGSAWGDGQWISDKEELLNAHDAGQGWEVFDSLKSLVDKSLLSVQNTGLSFEPSTFNFEQNAEPRFIMLETLREFAWEQLKGRGEKNEFQRKHARYYLGFAEGAEAELVGPQQGMWLERLERELDNLRAAMAWALEVRETETAARISGALARFWDMHGHWTEGRRWLEAALTRDESLTPSVRSKTLFAAAKLASFQDDNTQAYAYVTESLALFRQLGDRRGMTEGLNSLAFLAVVRGEYEHATELLEESLALNREMGDKRGAATVLANLGQVAMHKGQGTLAATLLGESLTLFKELDDKWGIAKALTNLGQLASEQGDYGRATALLEESLALHRDTGNQSGVVWTLGDLGIVALAAGDYERSIASTDEVLPMLHELGDKSGSALSCFISGVAALYKGDTVVAQQRCVQSLNLYSELDDKAGVAMALDSLARVTVAGISGNSSAYRAAQLAGAASVLREKSGWRLQPIDQSLHEGTVQISRTTLGEKLFAQAWAEGVALPLEQAIAYALEE